MVVGMVVGWVLACGLVGAEGRDGRDEPIRVRVPLNENQELDVNELIARLSERLGVEVPRPESPVRLPTSGLAGALTRQLLANRLGPGVAVRLEARAVVVTLAPDRVRSGEHRLRERLEDLARAAQREAQRQGTRYGLHARDSYRPNDPERPTVCLVHGLNSTSRVFVHMVGPLEEAGFGVVMYDYPYNQALRKSAEAFARDWTAFRQRVGEQQPWAIVAHSMGGLLARWYVEGDTYQDGEVSALVLLAPPNQGSALAEAQAVLQFVQSVQSVNGRQADALARLGEGLGEAADDLTPGSAFLEELNRHGRREGVAYSILAGDAGLISRAQRRRLEAQMRLVSQAGGLLGRLGRLATDDLTTRLDEITEGKGDGCVALASTRLEGVDDHQVIAANHLELIRAPRLYPEPGPVVSMPQVLRWLDAAVGREVRP